MISSEKDPDIAIVITNNFKDVKISGLKIKKLAKTLCNRFTKQKPTDIKYDISIAILDDNEIRELNRQFLNSNATTDCLSFDLSDDENGLKIFNLAVNGEMAVRQASRRGHSSEAELALYITHGLLHNLGFDDSEKSQARKMHETEDEILQEFGYGLVYNKHTKQKNFRARET